MIIAIDQNQKACGRGGYPYPREILLQ